MPIYEYFCKDCNVVFSFMSSKVAPSTVPDCPRCQMATLKKHLSRFSSPVATGKREQEIDETRIENAMSNLLGKAEVLSRHNENEVSSLVESFTRECGFEYSEELIDLLEADGVGDTVMNDAKKMLISQASVADATHVSGQTRSSAQNIPPEIDHSLYHM